MSDDIFSKLNQRRKNSRKSVGAALIASVVIHLVIGIIGGVWIIATYINKEETKFVAPPTPKIKIPPQTRQHRMNLAAHEALASKPTFQKRLVSLRETAFALPEAPAVNVDNMLTPDPAAIASNIISGLANTAGSGAGMGQGGSGGNGLGSAINFLGIKTNGKRILLLFDVSGSVVNKAEASGMPLSRIKEETINLIDKLPADSKFGIIQFVRNYKPFRSELIPATVPNRDLARKWIEEEWSESGTMSSRGKGVISPKPNGLPPLLQAAYEYDPDVIFLVADGSFQRTPIAGGSETVSEDEFEDLLKELNKSDAGKIPLHFIGFQMRNDDEKTWKKLTRRQGGSFKALK
ncbi:MAG: hypothetical protein AB8D78_10660 [Akkermansiaceae bacterium]